MGWTELKAADGHALKAWVAHPAQAPRGAVVVLQEIFGVNEHIRTVCDRYAAEGWLAVAPALFDRVAPQQEFGYGPEDMQQGRAVRMQIRDEQALADVQAAIVHAGSGGCKVATIGFCWGGTLSWLAAARLEGLACAVAYYGTSIAANVKERPRVPVLLHFGDRDTHIPPEHVALIAAAHPQIPLYRYAAAHGFHCDARASYDAPSAALAAERTRQFLDEHLAP
jgi:carboxymethylenebutenolidase